MNPRFDNHPREAPVWLNAALYAALGSFAVSFLIGAALAPALLRLSPVQYGDVIRAFMALTHQLLILIGVLLACALVEPSQSLLGKLRLVDWRGRYVIEAFGWELLCFPLIPLATWAFAFILEWLRIDPGKPMLIKFLLHCGWPSFTIVAVVAVVFAPLTEEIMFRRVIFEFLAFRLPVSIAFLATCAGFALIHFSLLKFPGLFVLGIVLQWIYLRHRSLYPAVTFHCVHNAAAIGVLLACRRYGVDKIPGL